MAPPPPTIDPSFLQSIYTQTPPLLHWPLEFCTFISIFVYVLSVLTSNVSQVDRLWTFLPTIYTAYFALLPLWPRGRGVFGLKGDEGFRMGGLMPYVPEGFEGVEAKVFSPRALLMFGVVMTWCLRLSYNAYRRGMFNFWEEDYRWPVLRQRIPKWLFHLTNLTFIAPIQNVILLLLGIPTYFVLTSPTAYTPLTVTDYSLASLALTILFFEFLADNQQQSYQTFKHAYLADPKKDHHKALRAMMDVAWPGAKIAWSRADAERGFVQRGLWAWSRHPNFLCEQSFWATITFFPILTSPRPFTLDIPSSSIAPHLLPLIALSPAITLCLLFYSSTLFSESISLSKYPVGYAAYQRRVAMFLPFLTPFWGLWVKMMGMKEEVEGLIWGDRVSDWKKVD